MRHSLVLALAAACLALPAAAQDIARPAPVLAPSPGPSGLGQAPAGEPGLWRMPTFTSFSYGDVSAELFTGVTAGMAKEFVYDVPGTGRKLSELQWRTQYAAIVGGRAAWRPLDWLTLRLSGWAPVASNAMMHDYDWLSTATSDWTDRSSHPDTKITRGYQVDGSVAGRFLDYGKAGVYAIGGFRRLDLAWRATGGDYVYSNFAFRDTVGSFAKIPAISYRQQWNTPYLGLGGDISFGDWTVTAEAIGSPFVWAESTDHHFMRGLIINDKFSRATMLGATLGAEYKITDRFSAFGRGEFQNYWQAKGTANYDFGTAGTFNLPKGGSGASMQNETLTLGIKAKF